MWEENPSVNIFACDFSPKAIELFQADERYKDGRCRAFVADITQDDLTHVIEKPIIDVATFIFVLSSIPPEKVSLAIQRVKRVLRPGGTVLVRDYCFNDAAQNRFKEDRKLSSSLYVRQDGTLAYYFHEEELCSLFTQQSFEVVSCDIINSKTINYKKGIDIDRHFIQAKFRLGAPS